MLIFAKASRSKIGNKQFSFLLKKTHQQWSPNMPH
jgi:hypothetical protein